MGFEQPGATYCIHFYMLFLCLILPGGFDPPPFRHCIQPTSFAKPCGGRGVGWSNFFLASLTEEFHSFLMYGVSSDTRLLRTDVLFHVYTRPYFGYMGTHSRTTGSPFHRVFVSIRNALALLIHLPLIMCNTIVRVGIESHSWEILDIFLHHRTPSHNHFVEDVRTYSRWYPRRPS